MTRLEQQRDAVIERLAKTDSECALVRNALLGREGELRNTQIDNELNQVRIESIVRYCACHLKFSVHFLSVVFFIIYPQSQPAPYSHLGFGRSLIRSYPKACTNSLARVAAYLVAT